MDGKIGYKTKAFSGVLAFFPVVAITTNLSTSNQDAKQIKKNKK